VKHHAEEKKGKAIMVINHEKHSDCMVFCGYYISNKTILCFNRIQGANKSG